MDADETFSVIIVEDDPVTASVVKRMIETKFSARVVKAGDCSAGRTVLSENPCDIVILDYQLPDGDGLSLMEEITSSDDHPAVIMAVSYTHLRAHETRHDIVCRLLLEKKKNKTKRNSQS